MVCFLILFNDAALLIDAFIKVNGIKAVLTAYYNAMIHAAAKSVSRVGNHRMLRSGIVRAGEKAEKLVLGASIGETLVH